MEERTASPGPASSGSEEREQDEAPELPLTMSASVMLQDLPKDATAALASVPGFAAEKVIVKFKAVGSAPSLAQDVCKITATRKFEEVVRYLRRKLRCKDTDSVFLYVNSAFAPSLDEVVGNLHQVRPSSELRTVTRANVQCFKNGSDQLVVAYAMTPAFG